MQIKFRAKDKDNGVWHNGYYVFHQKTLLCCATKEEVEENEEHLLIFDGCCDWNLPMPWYRCDIDVTTLGQFTNIMDSKGIEVYAGDILKDERGKLYIVYAAPGGFRTCRTKEWVETNEKPIVTSGLSELQNELWVRQATEVIGNIYDNPEMIKE